MSARCSEKLCAGDLEAMKCCLSLQQNIVAQAKTNSEAATWPSLGKCIYLPQQ